MSKVPTISLIEKNEGDNQEHLRLRLLENGDLRFEGHDIGKNVEAFFGEANDEHEYFLTIESHYKDQLFQLLFKESFDKDVFSNDVDFKKWLDTLSVPYDPSGQYKDILLLSLFKELFDKGIFSSDVDVKKWLSVHNLPSIPSVR